MIYCDVCMGNVEGRKANGFRIEYSVKNVFSFGGKVAVYCEFCGKRLR